MRYNQFIINEAAKCTQYAIDNGLLQNAESVFGPHDTTVELVVLQEAARRGIDIEMHMPKVTMRGNTGMQGRCSTLRTIVTANFEKRVGEGNIKWVREKRNHRLIAREHAHIWMEELRKVLGMV
jgi:hypothetical protein